MNRYISESIPCNLLSVLRLTQSCLEILLSSIVWTYEKNLGIKYQFTKYFKEICGFVSENISPSSIFLKLFCSKEYHSGQFEVLLAKLILMLLMANLFNAKWCIKAEKRLKPWHMGTHLRVLSRSSPMNINMTGFRWLSKIFCILVVWTQYKCALEGWNKNKTRKLIFCIVKGALQTPL